MKLINSDWHCIDDPARACVERDLKITLEKIRRMNKVVPDRSITIVLRIYLRSFLSVTQMHRTRATYDRVHTWRTTGGESRWKTARAAWQEYRRSRWDIIQFYEPLLPPLRLCYLYKSAAETRRIASWIHRSIYYRLPRCCSYRCLASPSPNAPAASASTVSLPAYIETIVLFPHVFYSPLRQLGDGLTRHYLLGKFLRGKLPLPPRWDMWKCIYMYIYIYVLVRLSGQRTITYSTWTILSGLFANSLFIASSRIRLHCYWVFVFHYSA